MTDCFAHKHTFSYRDNGKLKFSLHVLYAINRIHIIYSTSHLGSMNICLTDIVLLH